MPEVQEGTLLSRICARLKRRIDLDSTLREAALDAGAVPFEGQVVSAAHDGRVTTLETADGDVIECDAVIGADGAAGRVADSSGLVDRSKVQWGFAVPPRTSAWEDRAADNRSLGAITLVSGSRLRLGLSFSGWRIQCRRRSGHSVGAQRCRAVKLLREPFLDHIAGLGLFHGEVDKTDQATRRVLGGSLRLGMVGTVPARGTTLLVGDAAGLVNPLQGEGITQALTSGRAAGLSVLGNPGAPAGSYRRALANDHLPYHRITADVQRAMVTRPRLISAVGRVLTAPVIGRTLASGWGLYWNELLDGWTAGLARTVALCAEAAGRGAGATSTDFHTPLVRRGLRPWRGLRPTKISLTQVSGGPDHPKADRSRGTIPHPTRRPRPTADRPRGLRTVHRCLHLENLSSYRRLPFPRTLMVVEWSFGHRPRIRGSQRGKNGDVDCGTRQAWTRRLPCPKQATWDFGA